MHIRATVPLATRDRMADPDERRPAFLELGDRPTEPGATRLEGPGDRGHLRRADLHPVEWDHAGAPWGRLAGSSTRVSTSAT